MEGRKREMKIYREREREIQVLLLLSPELVISCNYM